LNTPSIIILIKIIQKIIEKDKLKHKLKNILNKNSINKKNLKLKKKE
jgi:hypothetical protein